MRRQTLLQALFALLLCGCKARETASGTASGAGEEPFQQAVALVNDKMVEGQCLLKAAFMQPTVGSIEPVRFWFYRYDKEKAAASSSPWELFSWVETKRNGDIMVDGKPYPDQMTVVSEEGVWHITAVLHQLTFKPSGGFFAPPTAKPDSVRRSRIFVEVGAEGALLKAAWTDEIAATNALSSLVRGGWQSERTAACAQ